MHFGMQDEEYLSSSKQNMCLAPCLILSIAWQILTPREILKNKMRMKEILHKSSCRSSMKNSGNKRMIERNRSWKHKVKPCNDLDGALRRYNQENLELRESMKHLNREFTYHEQTPEEWIHHLDEARIRIMLCVSLTN